MQLNCRRWAHLRSVIGALVPRSVRRLPARLMRGVSASGHYVSLMALGSSSSISNYGPLPTSVQLHPQKVLSTGAGRAPYRSV